MEDTLGMPTPGEAEDDAVQLRVWLPGQASDRRYRRAIILPDELEFEPIEKAEFTTRMVMAAVRLDADHTAYVLIPREAAETE
jgi:hypothetical protein